MLIVRSDCRDDWSQFVEVTSCIDHWHLVQIHFWLGHIGARTRLAAIEEISPQRFGPSNFYGLDTHDIRFISKMLDLVVK